MFSAILFDLDGTLVDTVSLYKQVYFELLGHFGVRDIHDEDFFSVFEKNASLNEYLDFFGVSRKKGPEFQKMRDEKLLHLFSNESRWLGDAEATLAKLSKQFSLGLVTGARKTAIDAIDSKLDFRKFFRTIVTLEDADEKRKPDPFGLLKAAEQLQISPEHCLYVGDFSNDVLAAKAAGMKSCFVASDTHQLEEGLSPDYQVGAVSELLSLLGIHFRNSNLDNSEVIR